MAVAASSASRNGLPVGRDVDRIRKYGEQRFVFLNDDLRGVGLFQDRRQRRRPRPWRRPPPRSVPRFRALVRRRACLRPRMAAHPARCAAAPGVERSTRRSRPVTAAVTKATSAMPAPDTAGGVEMPGDVLDAGRRDQPIGRLEAGDAAERRRPGSPSPRSGCRTRSATCRRRWPRRSRTTSRRACAPDCADCASPPVPWWRIPWSRFCR